MKSLQLWTRTAFGLAVLALAAITFAACVTPKQIMEKAKLVADDKKTYEAVGEATQIKFVFDLLEKLSPSAAQTFKGKEKIKDVTDALDAAEQQWQKKPANKDGKTATNLQLIQRWAEYGELVILTDGSAIALVVPGTAGKATKGNWKDRPIPNIAYAGKPLIDGKHEVTPKKFASPEDKESGEPMTDPEKVTAYRYRD